MYDDVFENVTDNSDIVFLDMKKEDFMSKYDSVGKDSAQDLVNNYFKVKSKDGIPEVTDVAVDSNGGRVRIVVHVNYDRDEKLYAYTVPDSLNIDRGR